ncbi:PREDICTED: myosin IC heavy chain-like [Chinchilla lanigera]|uniref:myosin IC heavy chain-like n=1 Tax=Chinchilla lanigera TaxID=34839 RepID=UPI00069898E3|nr:PREDICTED: myosin IC heavy chain-like [Chinchilla lanigera]
MPQSANPRPSVSGGQQGACGRLRIGGVPGGTDTGTRTAEHTGICGPPRRRLGGCRWTWAPEWSCGPGPRAHGPPPPSRGAGEGGGGCGRPRSSKPAARPARLAGALTDPGAGLGKRRGGKCGHRRAGLPPRQSPPATAPRPVSEPLRLPPGRRPAGTLSAACRPRAPGGAWVGRSRRAAP